MSIKKETRTFIETRAICLMHEQGRENHSEPPLALIQIIADKLSLYANDIAGYGNPPAMHDAWKIISCDMDSHTGQINMDMIDIATIARESAAYLAEPNKRSLDLIQRARISLRSQAFPPILRKLGEAAAAQVHKPTFEKGSFTPV